MQALNSIQSKKWADYSSESSQDESDPLQTSQNDIVKNQSSEYQYFIEQNYPQQRGNQPQNYTSSRTKPYMLGIEKKESLHVRQDHQQRANRYYQNKEVRGYRVNRDKFIQYDTDRHQNKPQNYNYRENVKFKQGIVGFQKFDLDRKVTGYNDTKETNRYEETTTSAISDQFSQDQNPPPQIFKFINSKIKNNNQSDNKSKDQLQPKNPQECELKFQGQISEFDYYGSSLEQSKQNYLIDNDQYETNFMKKNELQYNQMQDSKQEFHQKQVQNHYEDSQPPIYEEYQKKDYEPYLHREYHKKVFLFESISNNIMTTGIKLILNPILKFINTRKEKNIYRIMITISKVNMGYRRKFNKIKNCIDRIKIITRKTDEKVTIYKIRQNKSQTNEMNETITQQDQENIQNVEDTPKNKQKIKKNTQKNFSHNPFDLLNQGPSD